MDHGVHVAKNYTNYIHMVTFFSSFSFLRVLTDFYPLVVEMSIHCSNIEEKNVEFLPRNPGAKQHP